MAALQGRNLMHQKRIALLIDCDNVSHNAIEGVLEELAKYGMVNVRHAHGDWKSDGLGELNDNRLIAKKLSEHRRILCASPDYLARYGEPAQPKDLVEHNCLRFSGFASFPEWCLSRNGRGERVLVNGNLTSNDGESLLAAALQGAGIVAGGEWLMAREIAAGRLVQVLPGWSLDEQGGIYLLRPSARFAAASTLAFKEWVEGEFAQGPPWKSASL